MEKEESSTNIPTDMLSTIIKHASNGDKRAIEHLLDIFMPQIIHVSRVTRLPQEEAIQSIIVEFLDFLQGKSF